MLSDGIISWQWEACLWTDGNEAQQPLHGTGQVARRVRRTQTSGPGQDRTGLFNLFSPPAKSSKPVPRVENLNESPRHCLT